MHLKLVVLNLLVARLMVAFYVHAMHVIFE